MWEAVVRFFSQPPPAVDPVFIPWVTALIAGNIIFFSGVWALLKYIAKLTPWAEDDKIIQIITGAFSAIKEAVSPSGEIIFDLEELEEEPKKEKEEIPKEEPKEECEHVVSTPDAVVCEKCGQPIN